MTRYMRGFIVVLMLIVLAMGSYPASAATTGAMPSGETTIVDDSSGDQTDPHIGGTLVAYTSRAGDTLDIRYYDLATGVGGTIPGGGQDRLADTSGGTIVFTRTHFDRIAIHAFDASDESITELDPLIGSVRANPSIAGSVVVWEDRGPVDAEFSSQEIVLYDRVNENTVRLTDDSAVDAWPAVNSDGSVIVWEKCATDTGCNIWQTTLSETAWTASQLTSDGESNKPDTNGDVVVYQSTRNGETDIFWRPVDGGAEQQLSLPGAQQRPSISGDLIAFESETEDPDTGAVDTDIMVYDLGSDTVYPITDTADRPEYLSDIFVGEDGVAHVVYASEHASGERDIHAFRFDVPREDTTPPTLTLPADMTVEAESSEGTAVDYTVTAEDDIDADPVVDCQPPGGSVFPIGTTTVHCTATDDASNRAEGSFTVTVTEAEEPARPACVALDRLIQNIESRVGETLTPRQAERLIRVATFLQGVLECT